MLKNEKFKKSNIHKILHKKMYAKESYILEKLLRPTSSRNVKLKTYNEDKDIYFSLSQNNLETKKTAKNSLSKISPHPSMLELNESIINLFHKTNYLKIHSKELLEQNKEMNKVFFNRFQKFLKLEKEKEKNFLIKRNNSTNINPQSFSVFNDLVNKYKERDGILYTKEMFNDKDLYRETPILSKNEDKIQYFYMYNYDKYSQKTNINYKNLFKGKPIKKQKKFKTIKFNHLTITKFYNKLLSTTNKRFLELQSKEIPNTKQYNYNYQYLGNKDIKKAQEIPKIKKEIKKLESLSKKMKSKKKSNMSNTNVMEDIKTPISTSKNFFKKLMINNNNESKNEGSKELQSTKRSTKREGKYQKNNSLIYFDNNKSRLSIISQKIIFSKRGIYNERNINKNKNKPFYPSFSIEQKDKFINIRQIQDENNLMSQKTKTTFYSNNSNKEKSALLSPNNLTGQKFFPKKELTDTEKTYEGLRKMTLKNKNLILKNTDNYVDSKGYNSEKIKKSIKILELYNFLDRIKQVIDNYNCRQKINALYLIIGKKIPEKMNLDLKHISDLDKEISRADKLYYLSLLNVKS